MFEKKILAELLNMPALGHVKYVDGYPIPSDGYANTYMVKNKYYEVVFLGSSDTEKIMEINNITFLIEIHK